MKGDPSAGTHLIRGWSTMNPQSPALSNFADMGCVKSTANLLSYNLCLYKTRAPAAYSVL